MSPSAPRIASVALLLTLGAGCEQLAPAPAPEPPQVNLLSPATGFEVPFNTTFHVSAVARARAGALSRLQVVLRGAVSTRQEILLNGAEQDIELDLTVPKDALLGPDRVPLDLVLVVEAQVDGRTVSGPPAGVTLFAVDRTAPELTVSSPDVLPAPPGFDLAFPAGAPFRLHLEASDPIGGVTTIGVDAPSVLGGLRKTTGPPARDARFDVVFSPPTDADLELEVFASDTAATPNRTARTLRVRIGEGGVPSDPPQVTLTAPARAECAAPYAVTATATDAGAGLERLTLELPSGARTRYATEAETRRRMALTATVTAQAPAGRQSRYTTWARDAYGQTSPVRTATVVTVDTAGPEISAARARDLTPGQPWSADLRATEGCGQLTAAHLVLLDGAGTSTVVRAALGGSTVDGPVRFDLPEDLCAAAPAQASLQIVDDAGNASLADLGLLTVQDVLPPRIQVSVLQPGAGVRPGEGLPLQVDVQDFGRGVKSATVTVTAPDGRPLATQAQTYPDPGCRRPGPRALDLLVLVPPDLSLRAGADLLIDVRARDHADLTAARQLTVPLVDDAPPRVRFVAPAPDTPLVQGRTSTVAIFVADTNRRVSHVELTVQGPATLDGGPVASRVVGVASATVSLPLRLDPSAPLGALVTLDARVTDTSSPAAVSTSQLVLRACGAPRVDLVDPALGPAGGDFDVVLRGEGFVPGLGVRLGAVALEQVHVRSASVAEGRVPPGPHPAEVVAATADNRCGGQTASGSPGGAFRFVAPPTLGLVRPGVGAGTAPGAQVFVVAGARADGVDLTEVGARVGDSSPTAQPATGPTATLDAALLAPITATAAVEVEAWALDALGQRTTLRRALPLDGAAPHALSLHLPRPALARGEVTSLTVLARGADDRDRAVTHTASISSSRPTIVAVGPRGRLSALQTGTASISARLQGLHAELTVQVLDDALWVTGQPLLLSPLVPAGSASAAPGRLEVLHFVGGRAVDVSAQATVTGVPAGLVRAQGPAITGLVEGMGLLTIRAAGRATTRVVQVTETLDVPLGLTVELPSHQRFLGGRLAGEVRADRGPGGPWRLFVDAGGALQIDGTLHARGAPGARTAGGRGGPGAGAGGAPAAPGGGSGGGEAAASVPSGGGGGGAAGAGGHGGHPIGHPRASGGPGGLLDAVGGGGGGGDAGGGGGGGRVIIEMPGATLRLTGLIDLAGGPGATATSSTGGGGGGGGGRLQLRVGALEDTGRLRVCGGPGAGGRSGGGGGGGGAVRIEASSAPSPFIDVDRAGGSVTLGGAGTEPAHEGAPGTVER